MLVVHSYRRKSINQVLCPICPGQRLFEAQDAINKEAEHLDRAAHGKLSKALLNPLAVFFNIFDGE